MTRTQRGLAVAGAIVLAFAVGFVWQYTRAEATADRLEQAERELTFATLEATLGAAAVEVQRGAYEPARRLTSDFFTGLQHGIGEASAEQRRELEPILDRRDRLITLLSRGEPEGRDLLVQTYRRFRVIVGGPERAVPVSVPDTAAAGEPDTPHTPAPELQ